jgi:acyl-coenzyme A synthetase/AMP-(fatty) acid ligase
VFFAGEPLSGALVRRWREVFPESLEIVNLYGPTETTLVKCFQVLPAEIAEGVQPVGRPLPQTQALVLTGGGQLCGIGEPGEIVLRLRFGAWVISMRQKSSEDCLSKTLFEMIPAICFIALVTGVAIVVTVRWSFLVDSINKSKSEAFALNRTKSRRRFRASIRAILCRG